MDPAFTPSDPRAWRLVSREEALRLCGQVPVAVVRHGGGLPATAFGPGSPFYPGNGPYDYGSLRYFAALSGPLPGLKGTGRRTPAPPPSDLPEPEPGSPAGEPTREAGAPPSIRIVQLDCACFAPLEESIGIRFAIEGAIASAESIHIRVAPERNPDRILLERKVDRDPEASGSFLWDGAVTDGAYPGCLTPAGSPYLIQLGLTARGGSPVFTNKAAIRVELAQTELKVGDAPGSETEAVRGAMLALLREDLRRAPDQGTLRLPGSFFKEDPEEMVSNASFTVYGERLQEGLGVPLHVNLWIRGKDGGRKRAPRAVAGTRILWDAVPDDEAGLDANLSDRGVHPRAKAFMRGVGAYKHDRTEPKGYTAHWELGGIRAVEPAREWGRRQWARLDAAWDGEALRQRTWAGRSVCGPAGNASADSGILYFNGRIAGDRYRITAYADLDGSLDDKEPDLARLAPGERKTRPLALRNWRDVRITASYKVGDATTPISFEGPNREFRKAALSVVPAPGLAHVDIRERWKAAYREVLERSRESFLRDAAMEDPGLYPVRFLDPEDYWQKTNADAGFFGKIGHRIRAFFGATDESKYRQKCDHYAFEAYSETVKKIPLGRDGLTCIKFGAKGDHNQWKDSYTVGIAPDISGCTNRTQAVLMIFDDGEADGTVLHEMGHNLFLPHAPGHWMAGRNPEGFRARMHDRSQICVMSYHPDARSLCGLCLLRLAGWDQGSIENDGTVIDGTGLE